MHVLCTGRRRLCGKRKCPPHNGEMNTTGTSLFITPMHIISRMIVYSLITSMHIISRMIFDYSNVYNKSHDSL